MDPRRPQEEELSGRASVLVDLARRSLDEMSEQQRLAGLQGLRSRLRDRYRARRMRWTALAVTGLAVTGASAGVLLWGLAARWHDRGAPGRPNSGAPITLRVDSAKLSSDGLVDAAGSVRPMVRFSDGSQVSLAGVQNCSCPEALLIYCTSVSNPGR
jgi:hypothetical protein